MDILLLRASMSSPIDSAVLSTALEVTSRSARSLICSRAGAKGDSLPTAASMRRTPKVLRPALSDRLGRGLFIGTPRGLNHFHDLYQNAQAQAHWQAFRYTTEEEECSAGRNRVGLQ